MKITALETIHVAEFSNLVWVELTTDQGLVGLGETFRNPLATIAYLHETCAPYLLGKDPLQIERHARALIGEVGNPFAGFPTRSIEVRGNSAVDIALWDLFGQAAGQPLHQLLGGLSRDKIRIYIQGRVGGFPAQVAALFSEGRHQSGVERAEITFEIAPDRAHWGVEIAGKVKAWAKALTGPTSLPGKYPQLMNSPGCETGPGPQLATWGKSTVCTVDAFDFKWHWTTNSSKHIPFDWTGP